MNHCGKHPPPKVSRLMFLDFSGLDESMVTQSLTWAGLFPILQGLVILPFQVFLRCSFQPIDHLNHLFLSGVYVWLKEFWD